MLKLVLKLLFFAGIILSIDHGIGCLLKNGLDKYFGLNKRAGVLCIGHSHTMLGIDGPALERGLGTPVAKYAINGANTFDRLAMTKHYFASHPDTVRLVVYDVDDHAFTGAGLSSNSYRLFYPYIDNADIAQYVAKHVGSRSEYESRRLLKLLRFNSVTLNLALRGILDRCESFKTGRVDIGTLQADIKAGKRPSITVDPEMVKSFSETVGYIRAHNAKLVLLSIPTVDVMNDMDKQRHDQVMGIFRKYAEQDSGVVFRDYNPAFSHRHELFCDPIHLNREGQGLVTDEVIRDLRQLLKE